MWESTKLVHSGSIGIIEILLQPESHLRILKGAIHAIFDALLWLQNDFIVSKGARMQVPDPNGDQITLTT